MNTPVVKNLNKKLAAIAAKYAESNWRYDRLPLQYRSRRNYFTNSNGSCDFDPITGLGHSYQWYELTKVIRGQLVVNSYGYSSTTIKHINKVSNLLRKLKTPFICVQAPRGLQDLEACRNHTAREYARLVVKNKYARSSHGNPDAILVNARKIGLTFPKKLLDAAIQEAERERAAKLERQRERKLQLMQLQSNSDTRPENVIPLRAV